MLPIFLGVIAAIAGTSNTILNNNDAVDMAKANALKRLNKSSKLVDKMNNMSKYEKILRDKGCHFLTSGRTDLEIFNNAMAKQK
jgi:hypothetical protein